MKRLLILLLTLAAGVAACDRGPRLSDPAKTIRVDVGEEFQISLEDNPSTGYRWHLVDSASRAPLVLVDSAFWMSRANQKTDGGGGVKSWTFVSLHEGSATISLAHVPPSTPVDSIGVTTRFRVVIE